MTEPGTDDVNRTAQRVGVGCFTAFVGFWSGGMIGVFINWSWALLSRAPKCPGIPTCDWGYWATRGALLGMVTLPAISLWRLRRREAATNQSNRG